jgi:hypothetical protein
MNLPALPVPTDAANKALFFIAVAFCVACLWAMGKKDEARQADTETLYREVKAEAERMQELHFELLAEHGALHGRADGKFKAYCDHLPFSWEDRYACAQGWLQEGRSSLDHPTILKLEKFTELWRFWRSKKLVYESKMDSMRKHSYRAHMYVLCGLAATGALIAAAALSWWCRDDRLKLAHQRSEAVTWETRPIIVAKETWVIFCKAYAALRLKLGRGSTLKSLPPPAD